MVPSMSLNEQLALPRIVPVDTDALPKKWRGYARQHKLKLYIVVLYENNAGTGKLWPASNILERGIARGDHGSNTKAGDSTSGGYGMAMATAIKWYRERNHSFPIKKFVAVVGRSLPKGKRAALEELGVALCDAEDSLHAMEVAARLAERGDFWGTRQYWNPDNGDGYRRVAVHIAKELPELGVIAWGVGSGGGCSGVMPVLTSAFAQRAFPLRRVAVVVQNGQKIGGVRDELSLEPGTNEWRTPHIDTARLVGEEESYGFSASLWQQGLVCGPSTGFAAEGGMLGAQELVIMRADVGYRAADGYLHIAVPAMDMRDPYREEYGERYIYFGPSVPRL